MSTKNKSVASEAILEMKAIKEAMERESTDTIKALLSDAVKDTLRENIESDYVIIEGKNASNSANEDEEDVTTPQPEGEEAATAEPEASAEGGAEAPEAEGEEGGDEAAVPEDGDDELDMTQYQVDGDPNTLDLTGEQDPSKVIKVYKLLQNDDDVVIRKSADGKIELKDGQTGAEYVIETGADEGTSGEEAQTGEADAEQLDEEYEFELDDESVPYTEDSDEFAEDLEGEQGEEPEDAGEPYEDKVGCEEGGCQTKKMNEKTNKKCMKKQEKIYEVDLGYTDDYQKEDPIAGLSNKEVAPNKTRDVDAGVPKGTEKPWSGLEKKEDPYVNEEEADECGMVKEGEAQEVETSADAPEEIEEGTNVTMPNRRKKVKSHSPQQKKNPEKAHHDSQNGDYKAIDEIVNENKVLKSAVSRLRKELREAYVTNVNLGKITKLFLENTTSQKEKIDIVNRFVNEAKTVEQSKALYESINKELKKATSKVDTLTESTMKKEAAPINETKIYESEDLKNMRDLMNRVMSC